MVLPPNWSANVKLKTIPTNAPMTINPSNPMLITPDFSENTPPIATKISGAAYAIETGTIK